MGFFIFSFYLRLLNKFRLLFVVSTAKEELMSFFLLSF